MEVELVYFCPDSERTLNMIARQSRTLNPGPEDAVNTDVFKKTIEWGHNEIQRFAFYCFHIRQLSRTALQQLSRYHFICMNVMSGRHNTTYNVVNPTEFQEFEGWMKEIMEKTDAVFGHIPLESRRYAYPDGLSVNLFIGMNGQELRHFLKQRMDPHAQEEIRNLANKIYDLVYTVHPIMLTNLK